MYLNIIKHDIRPIIVSYDKNKPYCRKHKTNLRGIFLLQAVCTVINDDEDSLICNNVIIIP